MAGVFCSGKHACCKNDLVTAMFGPIESCLWHLSNFYAPNLAACMCRLTSFVSEVPFPVRFVHEILVLLKYWGNIGLLSFCFTFVCGISEEHFHLRFCVVQSLFSHSMFTACIAWSEHHCYGFTSQISTGR